MQRSTVNIDHLVIAANSLQQGVDYVHEQLGVNIPFGGVHESMGTHNHLMQLGDSVFLEVIAVNPDGKEPLQPRWYGLDDPYVKASIAAQPALVGWVVNTRSIDDVLRTAAGEGFDFGTMVSVSRENLNWKFGLPHDGRLLAAGMLPYIIEWAGNVHPAGRMPSTGCKLTSLGIEHPQTNWLFNSLQSIGAAELVSLTTADTPRLSATIESPRGLVTLRSPVLRSKNAGSAAT